MTVLLTLFPDADRDGLLADLSAAGLAVRELDAIPNVLIVDGIDAASFPLAGHPAIRAIENDGVVRPAEDVVLSALPDFGAWGRVRHINRDRPWPYPLVLPLTVDFTCERDGDGVDIYLIDTGILASHEQFGGRATSLDGFVAIHSHGTATSSLAAGNTLGIATGALIWMGSGMRNADGTGNLSEIITAMNLCISHYQGRYATGRPAVLSMSISSTSSSSFDTAMSTAATAGMVMVAAAANDLSSLGSAAVYPAEHQDVICVGGINADDGPYRYSYHGSNFGNEVDILGASQQCLVAQHTSTTAYATGSGTSYGTPHIAGIVACMLQGHWRMMTALQVRKFNVALYEAATFGRYQRDWRQEPMTEAIGYLDPVAEAPAPIGTGVNAMGVIPYPMLAYPLTYDAADADDANALSASGNAPAITPEGFRGDASGMRLVLEPLPDWTQSSSDRVSMTARVTLHARTRVATRDIIFELINNDPLNMNPKIGIAANADVSSGDPVLTMKTTNGGSITTRYMGKAHWRLGVRWPETYRLSGAHVVRPQTMLFLDADTLLIIGHYNDTETRAYRITIATGAVTGSFTFGTSTYRHIAAITQRANGEIWCVDYETGHALRLDLAASFTAGSAVILTTWILTNLGTNVLSGIEFITVASVEYVMIALYHATTTTYLYVIPTTEISGGATFAVANRYKRFVWPRESQGITIRAADGLLYSVHNKTSGSANDCPVTVIDIAAQIASLADGGTPVETRRWSGPSDYPEDIKFHPTTGECWIGTEGRASVIDNNGFLSYWRSPLVNNAPLERLIVIDYDGAGGWTWTLDGVFFNTETGLTPGAGIPDALTIGGPPDAAATSAYGFSNVLVRGAAIKAFPFTQAEIDALGDGSLEPDDITVIPVTLTNPGAESGVSTGWTAEVGAMVARTANPVPRYVEGGAANTQFFSGGAVVSTRASQRHELATVLSMTTTAIDALIAAENLWARVSWWQSNFDASNDPSGVGLRFLDAASAEIGLTYAGVWNPNEIQRWRQRSSGVLVPAGARYIDVVQRFDRTSGTNNDGYHDDIELKFYTR